MSTQQPSHGYGGIEDDSINLGAIAQRLLRHLPLIFTVTAIVTAITVLWTATRTPTYRAHATLLLEADESTGGVLSELAALTSDPAAQAEIALIQSRSLAVVTAGSSRNFNSTPPLFQATEPDFDPVGAPNATTAMRSDSWDLSKMEALDLATTVEAFDRRPHNGIKRRLTGIRPSEHRLHARMVVLHSQVNGPPRTPSVDVYFPDKKRVLVAAHKRFLFASPLVAGNEGVVEVLFEPGVPFQALGYQLQLAPVGDFILQRYRIRVTSEEDAVRRLIASTSASETGRKTNIVRIGIDDPCPYRAAETANALAKNYIRRSILIGRQKANRTLSFIDNQLSLQLDSLEKAEQKVADLQSSNPETISLSDSAKAIIGQLTSLELNRTQLQLAQTVLTQALGHLNKGDFEGLARLGQEIPNLLALGYIQELATLEAESLRLNRTDIAGYKNLLQAELLRLRGLIESVELTVASYEHALAAILADNNEAIGRIVSGASQGAYTADFRTDLNALASLEADIAKLRGSALPENPALIALQDARARQLRTFADHIAGALTNARATQIGYQALHADYTASIAEWPVEELSTIDQSVTTLQERVRSSLISQANGLADQISAISAKVTEQEHRLGTLPQSQLTLAQATRDLQTFTEISTFLLRSKQEAQITAAGTSASAVLIDPAVPPATRLTPMASKLIAMGIFLGLILGSALALGYDLRQAALYTEAEVEQATKLTVLGAIPDYVRGRTRLKGAKRGHRMLAMKDAPRSPQAEAYRAVRAALRHAMRGEGSLRTLGVTSCVPGEGKTITNANLAIAFAKAGRTVLLVDCDLRRPTIHKLFQMERGPGFAEVLEQQTDWRLCTSDTGVENLSILPAGQATSNAGELLVSGRSTVVLEELKEEYDLVVFDLPPANVVADVASFASNLDSLLIVYKAGQVPQRLLTRTAQMLNQSEINLTGVILNAVYVGRTLGAYEYGYGYGYQYEESAN